MTDKITIVDMFKSRPKIYVGETDITRFVNHIELKRGLDYSEVNIRLVSNLVELKESEQ